MATKRQLELARLLAEGVDGVPAMEHAGWPKSTACWLGLKAEAYLAKAGVEIPRRAAKTRTPITDVESVVLEVARKNDDDNPAPDDGASAEPAAHKPRGRPKKETSE